MKHIAGLMTFIGLMAAGSESRAADAYLKRIEDKIARAEAIAPMAYKVQSVIKQPIDLLATCESANALFMECEVPKDLLLGSINVPIEYWNSASYFTLISSLTNLQVNQSFLLEGPLNSCPISLGPTKTLDGCKLGDRAADLAAADVKLTLRVPPLPKWADTNRDKVFVDAVAKIETLTFTPHPRVLIENLNAIVDEMLLAVDRSMSDFHMLEKLRDGLVYDASTLRILYKAMTNEPSIGSGKKAKSGTRPLADYPLNKITMADNKTLMNEQGQPLLGQCGGEFTSHDSKHCTRLYYVARLLCEKGAGTIINPDTFEVTDLCMGGQGAAKRELDAKMAQLNDGVATLEGLQAKLYAISEQLKATILQERVESINHEIETYRMQYPIYRAIAAYEKDTKTTIKADAWVDALRQDPGVANWKGPYLKPEESTADGWGTPFVLTREIVGGASKIVLTSAGANRLTETPEQAQDNLVFENGERRR